MRTIYRDIEELIAAGVPIESVSGPEGGYRLASDQPLAPLTLDSDEALKLYVVSLLDRRKSHEQRRGDVLVEEPEELRNAIVGHLRRALDAYENVAKLDFDTAVPGFRNDDSRLRSTRGRTSTE